MQKYFTSKPLSLTKAKFFSKSKRRQNWCLNVESYRAQLENKMFGVVLIATIKTIPHWAMQKAPSKLFEPETATFLLSASFFTSAHSSVQSCPISPAWEKTSACGGDYYYRFLSLAWLLSVILPHSLAHFPPRVNPLTRPVSTYSSPDFARQIRSYDGVKRKLRPQFFNARITPRCRSITIPEVGPARPRPRLIKSSPTFCHFRDRSCRLSVRFSWLANRETRYQGRTWVTVVVNIHWV